MPATATKRKPNLASKVRRHFRALDLGKASYKAADKLLGEILEHKKAGDVIRLNRDQYALLLDNYAGVNRVYRAHGISRYEIELLHPSSVNPELLTPADRKRKF